MSLQDYPYGISVHDRILMYCFMYNLSGTIYNSLVEEMKLLRDIVAVPLGESTVLLISYEHDIEDPVDEKYKIHLMLQYEYVPVKDDTLE